MIYNGLTQPMQSYLLTAHHAHVARWVATESFQRCLSLASFSMVLQL